MSQVKLVQYITRKKAANKIKKMGGKSFSVKFTKKDGTERFMVCRRGVKQHVNAEGETVGLTGTGMAYNPREKRLFCVFDFVKKEYRMVNELTLLELHTDGVIYKIIEAHRDEVDQT